MEHLSEEFWSERYEQNQTGWDLGQVSPPLKAFFDQIQDKSARILIPGCGNGYEAIYLWNSGFKNVHVVDLAKVPLSNIQKRCPEFPAEQLHRGDFFDHEGKYDFIFEQTMFCAIDPSLRQRYADKVHELLAENGKLVGVLFNKEFDGGPPYGGNEQEYRTYFETFDKTQMEECYNSIQPRQGNELFIRINK